MLFTVFQQKAARRQSDGGDKCYSLPKKPGIDANFSLLTRLSQISRNHGTLQKAS